MPQLLVIRWRDIPAQVIVREGRTSEKRELPLRFVEAIDRAAMRAGLKDSDGYLGEWRRGDDPELFTRITATLATGAGLAEIAAAASAAIEAAFDDERLRACALADGWDEDAKGQ